MSDIRWVRKGMRVGWAGINYIENSAGKDYEVDCALRESAITFQ